MAAKKAAKKKAAKKTPARKNPARRGQRKTRKKASRRSPKSKPTKPVKRARQPIPRTTKAGAVFRKGMRVKYLGKENHPAYGPGDLGMAQADEDRNGMVLVRFHGTADDELVPRAQLMIW